MRSRTVADIRTGAERVLETADLSQVFVATSNFETKDFFLEPPFRTETEIQVKAKQYGEPPRVETWARYVTSAFKDAPESDESEPSVVWTAEVECVAIFDTSVETPSHSLEDLEAFALVLGAPTMHPYARECTQSLTAHSIYPALTLGLMTPVLALPDDHEFELPDLPNAD